MNEPEPNDRTTADPGPGRYRPGPHRVALVAAAVTWPLLFVGGLVTTYRVGMAVPDWPTTFGINMFVYDFWTAPWGVYVEHLHRLLGTLSGLGCVVLAFWFTGEAGRGAWRPAGVAVASAAVLAGAWVWLSGVEPFFAGIAVLGVVGSMLALWYAAVWRRGMPALGWLALTAVIIQGALGGYRVRLNSTDLAAVHGCTGQAFFALLVALCVVTGRGWSGPRPSAPDRGGLRWWAAAAALLVYAQIVAGALLRHRSLGLVTHSSMAVAVLMTVSALAFAVLRGRGRWPSLVPSARATLALVVVQVALGVASWWVLRPFDGLPRPVTRGQAVVRTAHQANGALLLAASTVLAMRAARPSGLRGRPSNAHVPIEPNERALEAAIR
ncbi:COX15/CtaA family protein [Tautonia plasticadhaerens]|uniref:Cytochrome oxidase assembly protein n=1 Tax=Tautonia plasticadhaerens TaxID=2527974 RepID=A0A518GZR4_9BACT|nr:cytochrome oxidase assembly protein [Tautonia plasticadhaerens]QDV34079.1 Cytochrome oxidase assembly protein [Tautonia plasticadhaerens]